MPGGHTKLSSKKSTNLKQIPSLQCSLFSAALVTNSDLSAEQTQPQVNTKAKSSKCFWYGVSVQQKHSASTVVNRHCLNVVLLQQQILRAAVIEGDRRTGQSTWHSRAVKTFHKNSEWNPDWHAPSIQNKWLLLTCPIGTYILILACISSYCGDSNILH